MTLPLIMPMPPAVTLYSCTETYAGTDSDSDTGTDPNAEANTNTRTPDISDTFNAALEVLPKC